MGQKHKKEKTEGATVLGGTREQIEKWVAHVNNVKAAPP